MNIFYLDEDPYQCAKYHFDKHVNKMILESVQMLSTAMWCVDTLTAENLYKVGKIYQPTHINHPSNKWIRQSLSNFIWLRNLTLHLNEEKKYRFNSGNHKSIEIIINMSLPNIKNIKFTDPPQCMPEYLKCEDTITAYRNYYMNEKRYMAKWKHNKIPEWWK